MMASADTIRLSDTVNRVLRERVGNYGFRGADVRVDYDHEGDEVVVIDAYFDLTDKALDPRLFYGLTGVVREALQAEGESRFPHIRNHFDERQQVAV